MMMMRFGKIALLAGLSAALMAINPTGGPSAQAGPLRDRMKARMAERLEEKRIEEARPIDLQAILPGSRKLTQSYGASPQQAMDVYIPPGVRDAPIIVMVHGGAWKIGDKANTGSVENKLKYWLPKGYVFISVNYRMLPDLAAYEQAQDVAKATQEVFTQSRTWGGSPSKIILMGHSAGAHLVALLSSKPSMVGQSWAGTVVLDSAVMKVSDTMNQKHPKFYDEAFGNDPAYWNRASPMDQWTPAAVPMMIVCSLRRPDKPCDDARAFSDMVARSGQKMPVLPQDLTHADINRTLGRPGAYTTTVADFISARLAAAR